MEKRKSPKSKSSRKGDGSPTSSKKTAPPKHSPIRATVNQIDDAQDPEAKVPSPASQDLQASLSEARCLLKTDSVPVIATEADPDMTKQTAGILEIAVTADPSNANQSEAKTPDKAVENIPLDPVITVTADPVSVNHSGKEPETANQNPASPPANLLLSTEQAAPSKTPDTYSSRVKSAKQLEKKGESFTLPSGETCIKMPNSIIEKHRKSWECFVLGQFYSDPPSQGTLHNIANGIWSKQYRDISVTKMEDFSFLFRIPNAATRNRVINQRLWQIEGQTMFVAKWEPGTTPVKPELTSAPIWLELRNVPFQFFNEDGLERIASQVGDPKFLHPATANKTNLEVAKVFTIIDPRKPLPEAVNVQFETGEISRVLVSSPWMPPVCSHCKEIGHSSKRCKLAPITCEPCKSATHGPHNCPKSHPPGPKGRKTRRAKQKDKEAHEVMLQAQTSTLDNPTPANAERELECIRKWEIFSKAEERFLMQKSAVTWLDLGDTSTTYYHRLVSIRRSANHIHYLMDAAGGKIEDQAGIEQHCVKYFSDLLGGQIGQTMFEQSDIDLLFDFNCSQADEEDFCKDFTATEIREAFFSLPNNKASGPDGFSSEFFKTCWSIIGPEVTEAVMEFFSSESILKQWNATTLVLIPKITNASTAADFRPISCLNTVYKVISKLLAQRLKSILPKIISQSQSAFMPGRLLAENVLLATDLVQGYNTANSTPRAMLKVDLRKAFDTLRWDFILGTLKALSLPERFIKWINQCISTASFTVSVNGSSSGYFASTIGIQTKEIRYLHTSSSWQWKLFQAAAVEI